MNEKKNKDPHSAWTYIPISELLAPLEDGRILHQGWSPRCEKEPSVSEIDWGVLKTTSIQPAAFLSEHNKRLPEHLEPRPKIEVKPGDILITCAGPRNRCGIACLVRTTRKRLMISGKMYRFRADHSKIDSGYLEAYLQSRNAQIEIDKMKTGGNESGLNLTHDRFRKLLIRVAPLDQQKLIVAEIEKQFSRLDEAVANLKRVKANFKRYQAAVLKAAVEGRLVETEASIARREGRGYETGEQLVQRILETRRSQWKGKRRYKEPAVPDTANLPGLPEGWTFSSLDSLLREPLRNGHSAKATDDPNGPRAFTLSAVTEGNFSEVNTKHTVAGREKIVDLWAQPGDIYIERSNTPELVGTARLYNGPANFAFIPDLLIRVRVCELVFPEFVEITLQSDSGRNHFKSRAQGISGSMPKIDQSVIECFVVPLPPLMEQQRIAAEIDRRLSLLRKIGKKVDINLQRAESVRQTILSKAFSGELVSVASKFSTHSDKSVAYQRRKKHFARAVLSAQIVHKLHSEPTFGRVKHQKIFHLCEYIAGLEEIQGQYYRKAAGPLDNKLMYANESELKKQQWYETIPRDQVGHAYSPLLKAGNHVKYLQRYWADKLSVIDGLIVLMRNWSTERCEIFSTTYAAWNDLIIWRESVTDDAIVREILSRWHDAKLRISEDRWRGAISWIREKGYAPTGFGNSTRKRTEHKNSK